MRAYCKTPLLIRVNPINPSHLSSVLVRACMRHVSALSSEQAGMACPSSSYEASQPHNTCAHKDTTGVSARPIQTRAGHSMISPQDSKSPRVALACGMALTCFVGVSGMNMERAIAAAERRAYLLPGCRCVIISSDLTLFLPFNSAILLCVCAEMLASSHLSAEPLRGNFHDRIQNAELSESENENGRMRHV